MAHGHRAFDQYGLPLSGGTPRRSGACEQRLAAGGPQGSPDGPTSRKRSYGLPGPVKTVIVHHYELIMLDYLLQPEFNLIADFQLTGDQPQAIDKLSRGIKGG